MNHYFDYNATAPLLPAVGEAMKPFWEEAFANPSSLHQASRKPMQALRDAKRLLGQLLGVSDDREIILTSGGTESNNTAIFSALKR